MTWAMSPAPTTPTRRRVGVELGRGRGPCVARVEGVDRRPPGLGQGGVRPGLGAGRRAYGSMACNDAIARCCGGCDVRLALVTEGMIHRSLDELMDWLDDHGSGGARPRGRDRRLLAARPLAARAASAARRRAWHARLTAAGLPVAAFNVSGNPLHPDAAIARRHDRDLRRTIELAADLGVDRIVAMSGCPGGRAGRGAPPRTSRRTPGCPDYAGVAAWQWENRVRPYWEEINELVARTSPGPDDLPRAPSRRARVQRRHVPAAQRRRAERSRSTSIRATSSGSGWTRSRSSSGSARSSATRTARTSATTPPSST